MISLLEAIILVGVSVLLFKKHPLAVWWKALRASQTEFKKALHENAFREVEEYKPSQYLGRNSQGVNDV
jgi:hypothetical protein